MGVHGLFAGVLASLAILGWLCTVALTPKTPKILAQDIDAAWFAGVATVFTILFFGWVLQ